MKITEVTEEVDSKTTELAVELETKENQLCDVLSKGVFDNMESDSPATNDVCKYLVKLLLQAYGKDSPSKLTPSISVIESIKPTDTIEAMLAAQMVLVNDAMLAAYRYSKGSSYLATQNQCVNSMTKLARTYTAQMEALNRHRGKGQQKITVEHLNVNDGGRAVVGSVGK